MIFIFYQIFFKSLIMEREPALFIGRASIRPKYQQSITLMFDPLAPKFCRCSWNSFINVLGNSQELCNIIFKDNRTLTFSDKPKLKKKQKINGGVFIWDCWVILRLAQIKTPPPWGFSRGSTVPAVILKFLTTTPNLISNF